jgi:hypothetical protein
VQILPVHFVVLLLLGIFVTKQTFGAPLSADIWVHTLFIHRCSSCTATMPWSSTTSHPVVASITTQPGLASRSIYFYINSIWYRLRVLTERVLSVFGPTVSRKFGYFSLKYLVFSVCERVFLQLHRHQIDLSSPITHSEYTLDVSLQMIVVLLLKSN